MRLKDKVEQYERALREIAAVHGDTEESLAFEKAPPFPDAKWPFTCGWLKSTINGVAKKAQWALEDGQK
jgi:hypothetical protein